ncbi:substrate-binding domain-containing protein [Microbacterium sp. KUDC0406]|uniref:substrate-binding domain-containing protein n=1 Tax=Microbacterium sp. KUDC0406 TaxID=2909588 RepID=UPI001F30C089|nr:substrate-binding domain-containing protein [Microbacterium sp. KUDC0406]UJP11749.1 substrate-binding domain-containing protein [Microbacterium sp. KUDC0406]
MLLRGAAALAIVLTVLTASACRSEEAPASESEGTIALLLPDAEVTRYETSDRPTFEEIAGQRCPTCTLLYANAGGSAARQQEQAEAMLARGARVLVIDAVDAVAAEAIVAAAAREGALVVAYDRFIASPDVTAYVSFDSELIGRMQALAVLDRLADQGVESPGILVVNGSATDPNAADLRTGIHSVLDKSEARVLGEFESPAWSATRAQDWVTGQLTRHPGDVDGIIAANDGLAGGSIASVKAAGIAPVPPVSGQDAELSAVQRILDGDQLMTVAKSTESQARIAAEVAVRLLRGEHPVAVAKVDGVPSFLLAPTSVFRGDIERVIIRGRVHALDDVCTPAYRDACIENGLIDKETP